MCRVWGTCERGSETHLIADDNKRIGESSCVKCGQCVQMCPTGASMTVLGTGQNWELTKETSICIYCGVDARSISIRIRKVFSLRPLGMMTGQTGDTCA